MTLSLVGSENNVVPVETQENVTGDKITLPPHSVSMIELSLGEDK